MRRRGRALGAVAGWAIGAGAQAAVVVNPVPQPIAPGITAGLRLFTQAQASADPMVDGFRTRIQSLQALDDRSNRLFVSDTRGTISVTTTAGGTPATWFDIRQAVANFATTQSTQTGLMSFAFHPNFDGDPHQPGYGVFYTIDTSLPTGTATLAGKGPGTIDHDDVIHEFTVADPKAATATIVAQREVLRIGQPGDDHGPGTIAFNPTAKQGTADYGNLYIGLGDGGSYGVGGDRYGNAQDPDSPFGKILRIDPAIGPQGQPYTIPAGNGTTGGLGEVYASGLRNPQQFSWDKSGTMYAADIGQSQLEEVDVIRAGANYGWPAREGTFARGAYYDQNVYDSPAKDSRFTDPVAQYDHEEIFRSGQFGLAAISGVFTYHGSALPALDGMVIVSDLVSGRLFYYDPASVTDGTQAVLSELMLNVDGADTTLTALDGNARYGGRVDLRMGEDANGELYLLSKTYGDIYRLFALDVPEPASWATMILGLGAAGVVLRRRRRLAPDPL